MGSADVWKQILSKMPVQLHSFAQQEARVASTTYALAAGFRAAEKTVAESPGEMAAQRAGVETLFRNAVTEKDKNVTDQSLQQYRVEFNRKFSMPAACLVFAFFAFPVGIRARRSGRTVGFGVGLLVAIIYWGLLIAGQTFGVRMSLSPVMSMWLPDAVVFVAGAIIFAAGRRS
jgi:lipopolysaccharide export system permease protein